MGQVSDRKWVSFMLTRRRPAMCNVSVRQLFCSDDAAKWRPCQSDILPAETDKTKSTTKYYNTYVLINIVFLLLLKSNHEIRNHKNTTVSNRSYKSRLFKTVTQ